MMIKELFKLKRKDYEFFPAVLSIQEAPPSPIGRLIIWVIASFILAMLLWAVLGQIDIVAVAQGKVIPDGNIKIVQPAVTGVVKELRVKDGDYVEKGAILIVLDKTVIDAKVNQLSARQANNGALLAVYHQLIDVITQQKSRSLPVYAENTSPELVARSNQLFQQSLSAFTAKAESLQQDIAGLKSQKVESENLAGKLAATLPIILKRHDAIERLFAKKMIAEKDYLDSKQVMVEAQYDLKTQRSTIDSLSIQILSGEASYAEMVSNKLLDLESKRSDLLSEQDELKEQIIQQREEAAQHIITAPNNGYVQDMVIHTLGGSLKATEPALKIIPNKDELVIEAMVLNRDVGFMRVGQEAVIKLDTFDFIKYGALTGRVISLSSDAIQDEKLGLVFKAIIKIEKNNVLVDGARINVNSGLSVIAEVKTGKRRIVEYFLNPVRKAVDESMKER